MINRTKILQYWVLSLIFSINCSFSNVYGYDRSLEALNLITPGEMLQTTPPFVPMSVKGLNIHPHDPFAFDFIIDQGDNTYTSEQFRAETEKLIKYFLASLTVPEEEMWVNLSPYEADKIIPQVFGQTEMGRDLLAQDYMLKQLTASLIYPEEAVGEQFWAELKERIYAQFGEVDLPYETFHKIWIIPERAEIYEHERGAVIIKSRLKVLIEEDYVAFKNHKKNLFEPSSQLNNPNLRPTQKIQDDVLREVILPVIEKEVNEGEVFANLRQIYHSMILASWYKQRLKESLLSQVYMNQGKTQGLDIQDQAIHQKIYNQYVEAFRKGVYDYIKEEYDPQSQKLIPRKYFSGGAAMMDKAMVVHNDQSKLQDLRFQDGTLGTLVSWRTQPVQTDSASITLPENESFNIEEWKRVFSEREDREIFFVIRNFLLDEDPSKRLFALQRLVQVKDETVIRDFVDEEFVDNIANDIFEMDWRYGHIREDMAEALGNILSIKAAQQPGFTLDNRLLEEFRKRLTHEHYFSEIRLGLKFFSNYWGPGITLDPQIYRDISSLVYRFNRGKERALERLNNLINENAEESRIKRAEQSYDEFSDLEFSSAALLGDFHAEIVGKNILKREHMELYRAKEIIAGWGGLNEFQASQARRFIVSYLDIPINLAPGDPPYEFRNEDLRLGSTKLKVNGNFSIVELIIIEAAELYLQEGKIFKEDIAMDDALNLLRFFKQFKGEELTIDQGRERIVEIAKAYAQKLDKNLKDEKRIENIKDSNALVDAASITNPGGIDFNPQHVEMLLDEKSRRVILPMLNEPVAIPEVEGFVPVIFNIAPILNLRLLLGMKNVPEDSQRQSLLNKRPLLKIGHGFTSLKNNSTKSKYLLYN